METINRADTVETGGDGLAAGPARLRLRAVGARNLSMQVTPRNSLL